MGSLGKTTMWLAVVIAAAVLVVGEAAIGCDTVVGDLSGCLPYVTNTGPMGGCCGGVKALYSAAKTTPDRQAVCRCIKGVAGAYPGIDYGKAAGLPKTCGVNIPYKISPSLDCSTVR